MRSAEAAKHTESMIQSTVQKVNDGARLVESTNTAFSNVSSSSAKVGSLMAKIAHSSKEQARGIEGLNAAVSEMKTAIDQEISDASIGTEASKSLQQQSNRMHHVVEELQSMLDIESG